MVRKIIWRFFYALVMVQKTACTFRVGWRQACEAQWLYQDWNYHRPDELAEQRIRLWHRGNGDDTKAS